MEVMHFGKSNWPTFEQGTEKEWLVTNGLGGYASSTVIGANTRKYHGLLVASLTPPVKRTQYLAKVDEIIETNGRIYSLSSNSRTDGSKNLGFVHLQRFELAEFPSFLYSFSDIFIQKTVFMVYGKNTTVIIYRIKNGSNPSSFKLYPLVNCRNFHWTLRKGQVEYKADDLDYPNGAGVCIKNSQGVPSLVIAGIGVTDFKVQEGFFEGIFYPAEYERGEGAEEDLFVPGSFDVFLEPSQEKVVTLFATVEKEPVPLSQDEIEEMFEAGKKRCRHLLAKSGHKDNFAKRLVWAADAFVVKRRSTNTKSVIAGYHWFNDWGRDTMISLPGLTLVTGRFNDAKEILLTYSRYCKNGLIPNMFPDEPGEPLYNTVDASLWFFQSVYKYLQYTGDINFILQDIYPVLKKIVHNYASGTDYKIYMDEDGLMSAGTELLQLTWMDAKVDNWVVTPRHGKPVEISALWYNALKIMEYLAGLSGESFDYPGLPDKVRQNFEKKFWYDKGGYWYDVIKGQEKDKSFRPNQIIAMGLTFSPAPPDKSRLALSRVWQELYASYGMRSLSCNHPDYHGVYSGHRLNRDGAYHQGTAWSWLIGPFITAYRRAHGYSKASREQAELFINPFRDHLFSSGVGYVSEIFDGDEPILPRGTIAQAWGVGEVLRSYVEDILDIRPNFKKNGFR